jgi:hypothetical protein
MQLMKLYGVDPRECEIYEPAPWWPRSYYKMAEERHKGLLRLAPRYDGNYELHNVEFRGGGAQAPTEQASAAVPPSAGT